MPATDVSLPDYDVIVIGAGAAGLLAAIRSAERGRRTLLLEKNRKAGVKILMSGGTRCNITHDCAADGIMAAFGSSGPFLHSPLAALSPADVIELFNAEGVFTKVEPGGKVFPVSDRAVDVLDALLRRLRRSGAEMALDEAVTQVERFEGQEESAHFCVTTTRRTMRTAKLVVTTGGKSYPGCGTIGDGYRWLAALGHTICPPRPALVPLTSDEEWLHELSGLTLPSVRLRVVDRAIDPRDKAQSAGRRRRQHALPPGVLIERYGSLLFTHLGLSGPAAMDVSRAVTGAKSPRDVELSVDFLPDASAAEFNSALSETVAKNGGKRVSTLLTDLANGRWKESLPRRLIESLLVRADVPLDRLGAELSNAERQRLCEEVKNIRISLTGTRGFDKAEVTAGGVALDEVDSRTMESKLVPGLFIAGEVLDLDGFIGGYNFQAAFSTGWLAGESV